MCLQHTRKLALLKGKACKALCGQKISLFGVLIGSRKHRREVSKTIYSWLAAIRMPRCGLSWVTKLCIKLLTSKHFSEKMQHFFCTAISYQPFCYFRGLKSGVWTAGAAEVRIERIFAAPQSHAHEIRLIRCLLRRSAAPAL